MGVHAPNEQMGADGLGESLAAHVESHESNTKQLLNLAEGKKKTDPRPFYNPDHPDNAWPVMLHHPGKSELTVGRTLKGVTSAAERAQVTKFNEKAKADALASGYRHEPYLKPQIAVLDPATEKAAMQKQNEDLRGQLAVLQDAVTKLVASQESK